MSVMTSKERRKALRTTLFENLGSNGVPIPQCIKDLRKIMDLNQAEFAEKVNISLSALRRIEQGNGNFTMDTLNKILAPFELSIVIKKSSPL